MRTRKIIGATALACAAVVTMAAPAFAHVSVNPNTATKGGFQTLTFQVPNEMDDANTVEDRCEASFGSPVLVRERAAEGGLDVPGDEDPTADAGDERRRPAGHRLRVRDRVVGRADQAG